MPATANSQFSIHLITDARLKPLAENEFKVHSIRRLNAPRAHLDTTTKSTGTDRGCVRSTSRSGTARPGVFGQLSDSGHPHLLRLVLRTQPRSGGGPRCAHAPRAQDKILRFLCFLGVENPRAPTLQKS